MKNKPKVVPIIEKKTKLIAKDFEGQRVIIGIGAQRTAIDFFHRITRLPPKTGDKPAAVVSFPNKETKISGIRRSGLPLKRSSRTGNSSI